MGRANLRAQRFTSPPTTNALDRFRLVLKIEPGNADARAGIESVAQAYVDLAEKQDRSTELDVWLDYLARADTIAREDGAAAAATASANLRKSYADELVQQGSGFAAEWKRDAAVAAFERALRVFPGYEPAKRGLRDAQAVGRPGYVFKDSADVDAMPEMVVVDGLAFGRSEVTVAQFSAFWDDAGKTRFGAALPSCRDRESFFRSSRKDSWSAPGIPQEGNHPVVCVSFDMAQAYSEWLSERSGKTYRLPTAAEWKLAGSTQIAEDCSANTRDASFRETFGGRDGVACNDGFAATSPIRLFAARKSGLYDADGNVREWVSDCDSGNCRKRLALGASWFSQAGDPPTPDFPADTGFNTIGFRVTRELE
jgi:formylglycine-generating enzyme required for sulfatase activity